MGEWKAQGSCSPVLGALQPICPCPWGDHWDTGLGSPRGGARRPPLIPQGLFREGFLEERVGGTGAPFFLPLGGARLKTKPTEGPTRVLGAQSQTRQPQPGPHRAGEMVAAQIVMNKALKNDKGVAGRERRSPGPGLRRGRGRPPGRGCLRTRVADEGRRDWWRRKGQGWSGWGPPGHRPKSLRGDQYDQRQGGGHLA